MGQRDVEQKRAGDDEWPKVVGDLLSELEIPEKMVRGESTLAKQHQDRKAKAQQKREDAVQLAESALERLSQELENGKSETLVAFLDTMATFHSYSFNNQLLISIQNPDATRVAGFQAWKKLGRFVKKGEKGIRILAPMLGKPKHESTDEELIGGEEKKKLYGFRVVSVFDISQTDGKPLPDIGAIQGEPGDLLPQLRDLVVAKNIQLKYESLGGPDGISKGGEIVLNDQLEPADEFAVLVHEFAHELLHRGDRRAKTTKTQRETEAEAVAYVVCRAFGIDSLTRSSDYIQLYHGDSALLTESLDFIRSVSVGIIRELESDKT